MPALVGASLLTRGFEGPTPIQIAAAPVIGAGSSALVHAETGSGKTLAYLLPLVSRLADRLIVLSNEGRLSDEGLPPCSLVVALPTAELAAQTAREVATLLPGSLIAGGPSPPFVQHWECQAPGALPAAPIVVGTVKALAASLVPPPPVQGGGQAAEVKNAPKVGVLVMDEVDRLMRVPGKYATRQEEERAKRHPRPATILLEAALATNPKLQV